MNCAAYVIGLILNKNVEADMPENVSYRTIETLLKEKIIRRFGDPLNEKFISRKFGYWKKHHSKCTYVVIISDFNDSQIDSHALLLKNGIVHDNWKNLSGLNRYYDDFTVLLAYKIR